MESERNEFSIMLRQLRVSKGIKQYALADSIKMDASQLAGLESGRRAPPRDGVLMRLGVGLALTQNELMMLMRARNRALITRYGLQDPKNPQTEDKANPESN